MRMTLPLPNWRSIWDRAPCRAVSRAFEGSWLLMSTTLGAGSDRTSVLRAFVAKSVQFCDRAWLSQCEAPGPTHIVCGAARDVTKDPVSAPFVTSVVGRGAPGARRGSRHKALRARGRHCVCAAEFCSPDFEFCTVDLEGDFCDGPPAVRGPSRNRRRRGGSRARRDGV